MMQTKTLIVLSPGWPENEEDSTCLPAQQIFLNKLKVEFPAVKIIVLAFQYPFFKKEYDWNGITIISFNGRNRGKLLRRLLWLRVWKTLKSINRQHDVIGILSFWLGECALVGKWLSEKYSIKHLTWLLGQDAKKGNKYFKRVKPNEADLIANSDFISDTFYSNYSILPGHIIPGGVDPKAFSSEIKERTIDVMGAGSLILLKQFHLFIEVIQYLRNTYPGIQSIICGKGPEKERLQEQINNNGLQKNIILMDEVPHDEVLRMMQSSRIFLHTSIYEGFSNVCLEALYAGAHVVSFVKPMKKDIEHFHVTENKLEMIKMVDKLLKEKLDTTPVAPYLVDDAVKEIMELYPGDHLH